MLRTLQFALRRDPANSRAIGYCATQQNAAYNVGVDVLSREPELPKRSGKRHPDALNKRITAWRQAERQRADAPYHIHQEGAEQAWEANQRLQANRADRLARIAAASKQGEPPHPRDRRPHRRTLQHRRRKRSRLSLTIADPRLFQVSADGQTVASRQCRFTLQLRGDATLNGWDVRSIHLVPVQEYSRRTPLAQRHYCLHVQVQVDDPTPLADLEIQRPEDILGADRGAKNHIVFSSGARAHHARSGQASKRRRQHQRHIARKPKTSKRRRKAIAQHRKQARRYAQQRDQDLRQQIGESLRATRPQLVAVESLQCLSMMASARGTAKKPGRNVAAKRKLNASLAEAAIGHIGVLLRAEAAKLGIPTVSVPPPGTSRTCPQCGHRRQKNRESQAGFRCRSCGLYAHADWTAAVIIRNRAYVRYCEWRHGHTPSVEEAPTGWREQPSRSVGMQLMLMEKSVFQPKGNAMCSARSNSGASGRVAVCQR